MDEIEFVAKNFETTKDFECIRKNNRCSKVKSHLKFYKRVENTEMEVVRILQERMDLKNRFEDKKSRSEGTKAVMRNWGFTH